MVLITQKKYILHKKKINQIKIICGKFIIYWGFSVPKFMYNAK